MSNKIAYHESYCKDKCANTGGTTVHDMTIFHDMNKNMSFYRWVPSVYTVRKQEQTTTE